MTEETTEHSSSPTSLQEVWVSLQRDAVKKANVPAEDMDSCLEEVFNSISPEFFKELMDTQIAPALLLGKLDTGKYESIVKWLTPDSNAFRQLARRGIVGEYWMITDITTIAGKPPSSRELWKSLVRRSNSNYQGA